MLTIIIDVQPYAPIPGRIPEHPQNDLPTNDWLGNLEYGIKLQRTISGKNSARFSGNIKRKEEEMPRC